MDEYFMDIALKEAEKAFKKGEVPVGCVIACNDKVISKSYNRRENEKNAINHAEILAISKACKKMKSWRLDDCVIYITMEPCLMCFGAIMQSRIGKIVYSVENEKYGYSKFVYSSVVMKNVEITKGVLKSKSLYLLKLFFKNRR